MVKITGTNIIVDDFTFFKINQIFKNNIYFLTHMHTDHYRGLTDDWKYGKIYCSKKTAILLKIKYPNLENICGWELNKFYAIYLKEDTKEYKIQIYLMDSNHIVGSVMIYFSGFMGNVLHTGDLRFNKSILKEKLLFKNDEEKNIHIDTIYLDNTFCDPEFKFPNKEACEKSLIDIIKFKKPNKVYIHTYSLGKEEIGVSLANYFNTKIVLEKERYNMLKSINFNIDCFTTNKENGFIYFMSERLEDENEEETNIYIKLTGWANTQTYINKFKNNYMIPYSSHSNFEELQTFISILKPSMIKPIVKANKKEYDLEILTLKYGYVNSLKLMRQKGMDILNKYLEIDKLSTNYKENSKINLEEKFNKDNNLIKKDFFNYNNNDYNKIMNNVNLKKKYKDWGISKKIKKKEIGDNDKKNIVFDYEEGKKKDLKKKFKKDIKKQYHKPSYVQDIIENKEYKELDPRELEKLNKEFY